MNRSMIIMAKVPRAGNVKTRLEGFLSPATCRTLAESFLQDAVIKARSVCDNIFIAFFPSEEIEALRELLPFESNFIPQDGETLGDRMGGAFRHVYENGATNTVMIGTDSPTLPHDHIESAFGSLETGTDVVLGNAEDGGIYLIGMRKLHQEIFTGVAWSSPQTAAEIIRNVAALNLTLEHTPVWYDIDEPSDLIFLRNELLQDENARRRAPASFQWVVENADLFDST